MIPARHGWKTGRASSSISEPARRRGYYDVGCRPVAVSPSEACTGCWPSRSVATGSASRSKRVPALSTLPRMSIGMWMWSYLNICGTFYYRCSVLDAAAASSCIGNREQ